jgi:DivIVA domain-containing protein
VVHGGAATASRLNDGYWSLTAEDVRTAHFDRPHPFVRGYDPDQVDEFLDDAIAARAASDTT